MPRRITRWGSRFRLPILLFPVIALAGILPETIGPGRRTSTAPAKVSDQALWNEYGLQDSEQATYDSPAKSFTVTAYRLPDATASLAAFQWQRPAEGKPSSISKLAVETPRGLMLAHGNYLLVFDGHKPDIPELNAVLPALPSMQNGPLPTLPDYLPTTARLANSERYITGPVSLQAFLPGLSPAAAGFHFGVEGQLGSFSTQSGGLKLAVFSYPTPEIARDRLAQFRQIPNGMAKRTGPLVAIVLPATDANEAEKLLSQIQYQAEITVNQRPKTKRDNPGNLLVNIFLLIALLAGFFVVSGLAFGGMRMILRRSGPSGDGEPMITLHLSDRERVG